jgi:hypothetical protein
MPNKFIRAKKRYLIIGLGLFLGLVLSLILSFNFWCKVAVEKVLTSTLGVPTQIQRLKFNPLAGSLEVGQLIVENPAGFSSPYLLGVSKFELQLNPSSLFTSTVEVQKLSIDRLNIFIEQGFSLNLSPTLDRLKENAKNAKSPEPNAGSEIRIKAKAIDLTDIKVAVKLPFWKREVKLPNVNLENLQTKDGEGMLLSEVFSQIFAQAIAPIVKDNLLELPKSVLELLRRSVP